MPEISDKRVFTHWNKMRINCRYFSDWKIKMWLSWWVSWNIIKKMRKTWKPKSKHLISKWDIINNLISNTIYCQIQLCSLKMKIRWSGRRWSNNRKRECSLKKNAIYWTVKFRRRLKGSRSYRELVFQNRGRSRRFLPAKSLTVASQIAARGPNNSIPACPGPTAATAIIKAPCSSSKGCQIVDQMIPK